MKKPPTSQALAAEFFPFSQANLPFTSQCIGREAEIQGFPYDYSQLLRSGGETVAR